MSHVSSGRRRVTLRERFFPLHQPADINRFLAEFPWCVIFKAGTSDKTFDAWRVAQDALEPRHDVAVGLVRLPEDRDASARVTELGGIAHRSPQFILFEHGRPRFHLDEFAIAPDQLVPLLREHLPAQLGPPVRNDAVVTLEPYRALLAGFLQGTMPDEQFQWGYLDRLEREAAWRATRPCAPEQPVREPLGPRPEGRACCGTRVPGGAGGTDRAAARQGGAIAGAPHGAPRILLKLGLSGTETWDS